MKSTFLCLLLLLVVNQAFAHLGGIAGQVRDQQTGQPLAGVVVQLSGTGKASVTNELGRFRFMHLPPATYRIEVSHVGFQTVRQQITVDDDQITTVAVT
ncbi:carboxypeptidase-like regulatory domain-containing protein, partial [Arsenicibacter rosenii]|uniref:carboxypeptidase-like regulatory domain-containing protein n=1 Tax=Arsenicibacter rosenii TaxID=1750698 RepID=UPI00116044B7